MKPAGLVTVLQQMADRGHLVTAAGRQGALESMAKQKVPPGHLVAATGHGVHVVGPRAGAVAKRLAQVGGRGAQRAAREQLS